MTQGPLLPRSDDLYEFHPHLRQSLTPELLAHLDSLEGSDAYGLRDLSIARNNTLIPINDLFQRAGLRVPTRPRRLRHSLTSVPEDTYSTDRFTNPDL